MNKIISLKLNNHVLSGVGSLNFLVNKINEYKFKKIGIIIDKNLLKKNVFIKKIIKQIKNKFNSVIHIYPLEFEPNYDYLNQTIKVFKRNGKSKVDCILGIGGGSVMDTAKAIAVMCSNNGSSIKFKGFPINLNKPIPVIAIPSTTGTGSELVFNASVIDNKNKQKMGINDVNNYPILAILDPRIVAEAPLNVVVSSTFDALVHAIESFSSPQTNEITKIFVFEAIKKIFLSFPKILKNNHSIKDWTNLQWAAYFAMVGLSNTSSGPTGALSYFLGVNFKVPHGHAGAFFLRKIIKFNHENGFCYSELYNFIPKKSRNHKLSKKNKSNQVIKFLESIFIMAKIPKEISAYGVKKNDIVKFVNFSNKASKTMNNNPIKINRKNILNIIS